MDGMPKVYAIKHKDEAIRSASRSGGIFTALSDAIFQKDGVVYGCVLKDLVTIHHVRATSPEERNAMRGSKYVQSDMGDTFASVKQDLEAGLPVLFSGTSCQVAGLKSFLQKDYENLICVDIVCHGVPSSLIWKDYLNWQEQKHGKAVAVNFRNKKEFGWQAHMETLDFSNGEHISSRVYANLFLSRLPLRPSCYHCPYKSIMHPGDITIADYWGIDKAAPGFNDDKGVSLVLINNAKGEALLDTVRETLQLVETKIEDSMQPSLKAPFPEPENRQAFWEDYYNRDFSYIAKKYGTIPKRVRLKRSVKRILKKLLGR